jgi:hypothetical protein
VQPERWALWRNPQALKAMLGPKTRLVATVHVSNMLASVTDVADLSRAVHAVRRYRALLRCRMSCLSPSLPHLANAIWTRTQACTA